LIGSRNNNHTKQKQGGEIGVVMNGERGFEKIILCFSLSEDKSLQCHLQLYWLTTNEDFCGFFSKLARRATSWPIYSIAKRRVLLKQNSAMRWNNLLGNYKLVKHGVFLYMYCKLTICRIRLNIFLFKYSSLHIHCVFSESYCSVNNTFFYHTLPVL
jgi:hypothetical protein